MLCWGLGGPDGGRGGRGAQGSPEAQVTRRLAPPGSVSLSLSLFPASWAARPNYVISSLTPPYQSFPTADPLVVDMLKKNEKQDACVSYPTPRRHLCIPNSPKYGLRRGMLC